MQWRGPYSGESCGSQHSEGSKIKKHVNMLKKYIAREPDAHMNVVPTSDEDGATAAVAIVIHQDTEPELGEVPYMEGYRQGKWIQDVTLGED